MKTVLLKVKYIETTDNTFCDVKRFEDFLCRHFYKHKDYKVMSPRSDQSGQFFTTAKTHNFQYIEDISLGSLRLRPIIDQAETYIYNPSKFVVKYI